MKNGRAENRVFGIVLALILVFAGIGLVFWGIRTFQDAKQALTFAETEGQAWKQSMEIDNKGQRWLCQVDQVLLDEMKEDEDNSQCSLKIKDRLGDLYNRETGIISTDIPLENGQFLHIDLSLMCGIERFAIESWYVCDSAGSPSLSDSSQLFSGKEGE